MHHYLSVQTGDWSLPIWLSAAHTDIGQLIVFISQINEGVTTGQGDPPSTHGALRAKR
jgi:hypothetical protein